MLAVIGDIVQDIVVWQREKVRPATDTASDIFIQRGGSAANVAAFAGPRTPTRFIGCVGDDLAGACSPRAGPAPCSRRSIRPGSPASTSCT